MDPKRRLHSGLGTPGQRDDPRVGAGARPPDASVPKPARDRRLSQEDDINRQTLPLSPLGSAFRFVAESQVDRSNRAAATALARSRRKIGTRHHLGDQLVVIGSRPPVPSTRGNSCHFLMRCDGNRALPAQQRKHRLVDVRRTAASTASHGRRASISAHQGSRRQQGTWASRSRAARAGPHCRRRCAMPMRCWMQSA